MPPHLTAAAFILHRAFKDDTLETAVTVKLLRSFSSTHPSLNDLMQMATWIFMRRMCFTTCLLGCTDKGGPVKSDALQHLRALCVRLGGKYEMDGTQSMKWMRDGVQLWATIRGARHIHFSPLKTEVKERYTAWNPWSNLNSLTNQCSLYQVGMHWYHVFWYLSILTLILKWVIYSRLINQSRHGACYLAPFVSAI